MEPPKQKTDHKVFKSIDPADTDTTKLKAFTDETEAADDDTEDEEDKKWLALQEKRKQEVLKETKRVLSTYIPVREIDKSDRVNVVEKDQILQHFHKNNSPSIRSYLRI